MLAGYWWSIQSLINGIFISLYIYQHICFVIYCGYDLKYIGYNLMNYGYFSVAAARNVCKLSLDLELLYWKLKLVYLYSNTLVESKRLFAAIGLTLFCIFAKQQFVKTCDILFDIDLTRTVFLVYATLLGSSSTHHSLSTHEFLINLIEWEGANHVCRKTTLLFTYLFIYNDYGILI